MSQPSRRDFLKAGVIITGSLILPKSLLAGKEDKSFWFFHADTGDSWPVADPVAWSLDNARQPVLERAFEGLLKLTPSDEDRVICLITRRCKLNLLELHPKQVAVHHWGQQGRADLRPFFKAHGLARREIEVVMRDRKKDIVTMQTGDDFLFGDRPTAEFPVGLFLSKWQRRFEVQADDRTAAPGTWSGFAWEGVEDNKIPWTALKSAWRRSAGSPCLNCDGATILTNFGNPWVGMFNRSPSFIYICGTCCRSFRDESVRDVANWMATNLDAEVMPGFVMMWDRRVTLDHGGFPGRRSKTPSPRGGRSSQSSRRGSRSGPI